MSLPVAIGGSKLRDDDSGLQRVGPLAEVPGVLREFGVDPARVLSEAGLPEGVLDDSGNRITFRAMGRLLECGARATQCPHFGLLVGQRARVDHFGLVGRLIENAPTLGAAIMDFADNQHRYVRGSVIHVLFQNSDCIVTYSIYQSSVQAADQIIDTAVASGFRVLTSVSDLAPSEVRLPRRTPDSPSAYRAVFGLRPRFDSGIAALVFPEHRLRHPLPRADASLRRSLEASVANYWAIEQPDFVSQVVRMLRARISTRYAGKETVAEALSVHPRELTRRLTAAGTSFRSLASEARFETACHLLSATDLTVSDIARTLYYADASGFIWAFTRTSGISPTEWRKRS